MKGLIAGLMLMLAVAIVPAAAAKRSETVRVQINKEKSFPKAKLSVRFVELVEDSRCPADAQCVWAGNAKVKIRVTKNGKPQDLTLDTNGPHQYATTADGYSIILFPEGKRTEDGSIAPFRAGVGMMAARLDLPVVPVRIDGLHKVLHHHMKFPKRGPVRIAFGAPLHLTGDDYPALARRVEEAVKAL